VCAKGVISPKSSEDGAKLGGLHAIETVEAVSKVLSSYTNAHPADP
jgi:hypothetical protein